MIFYEAQGGPNACGPNCSQWIAAEGKIERDTVVHLQHLLAELHGAKPPIFFHSPGGSVTGSIALGRFIRDQKMTVSVSHTMPLNCDRDQTSRNSCGAQTHHRIEAELDPLSAMCNSACVFALAGGAVRHIPPWITLGIHDISIDPSAAVRHSALATELAEKEAGTRLRSYLRQMGIDGGLLDEAFAIPHTTIGRLSRDDAARFGLDRREFAESEWQFIDKPTPALRKYFFLRTTTNQPHYINAFVNLSCAKGTNTYYVMAYVRERLAEDVSAPAAQPPINISLNEKQFRFYRQTNEKFYVRSARLASAALNDVSDAATMALPGGDFGRQEGTTSNITLSMAGYSAIYDKLQAACAQSNAQTVSLMRPGSTPFSAQAIPPLRASQLKPGVTRSVVDATIGAPTKTIGTTALYSYTSSDNEPKVMAGYFDTSGRLQRFARYALKDEKVIDEISKTELGEGRELSAIRPLLAKRNSAVSGSATPAPPPAAAQ